jgi:hypothetical protein
MEATHPNVINRVLNRGTSRRAALRQVGGGATLDSSGGASFPTPLSCRACRGCDISRSVAEAPVRSLRSHADVSTAAAGDPSTLAERSG